jgi:dihydrofolate reductase
MDVSIQISIVVAVSDNGVIGRGGALPWHLPDDLKHFKAVTMGKPVLMGRRTFESIGRPLPGRRNLVLSRTHAAVAAGVERVHNLEQACALVGNTGELCVIGGAEVYGVTLRRAGRIYLTQVHASIAGDTYFPLQELKTWRELERVEHPADARHEFAMSFVTLDR